HERLSSTARQLLVCDHASDDCPCEPPGPRAEDRAVENAKLLELPYVRGRRGQPPRSLRGDGGHGSIQPEAVAPGAMPLPVRPGHRPTARSLRLAHTLPSTRPGCARSRIRADPNRRPANWPSPLSHTFPDQYDDNAGLHDWKQGMRGLRSRG